MNRLSINRALPTIDGMLIKHVWSHFTKFVKTRFLAKKNPVLSSDVEQCSKCHEAFRKHRLNMFRGFWKCFENTVLGSKILFSAQMWNNAKKNHETPRKHQLNMFWGFSRISWKSGSRLKNPVLGSDVEQCYKKYIETPRKHQQSMF